MKPKNLSNIFRSSVAFKHRPSSSSSSSSSAADDNAPFKVVTSEVSSRLSGDLPSILHSCASRYHQESNKSLEKELNLVWFPEIQHWRTDPLQRKEVTRSRREKFSFGNHQCGRFSNLVNMCANKLGTPTTIQVFGKLGRVASITEGNALIKRCIEGARIATDEVAAEKHIQYAVNVFKAMKEQGFPLEEETYGPFLEYLIDMSLTKEFSFFCDVIKKKNPSSLLRLRYYEMLLWIRVNDEEKIQELCNDIESYDGENKSILQVNYSLALCKSDRAKEIVQLLESMDITKFSSTDFVAPVFKCLGRLLLESFAEKVLMDFKECESAAEKTSLMIYNYVSGIPNLAAMTRLQCSDLAAFGKLTNEMYTYHVNVRDLDHLLTEVEDVILKFRNLHRKLEVTPSSESYENLIMYCCTSLKGHVALELVDEMSELGLKFSLNALHFILQASSENCDFNLVHQIYSVIKRANLEPKCETFRSMINLCVKMKDYEGAYSMLRDLKKMNLSPTAAMYNAIMVGYFREKKMYCGLKVLKEMEEAGTKPDFQTFSHLISNCKSEEDINMYYEEMKRSGIKDTKQVFMALINAYAACGQFEKAKQVVEKAKQSKSLGKSFHEVKSVLVQALASHGQLSDAITIYEEIKQAGRSLEPKAVISLIEHLQSDEEALNKLLLLLETLNDPNYWLDGCLRTILYCVRYKHLRTAITLLEQLRDQICTDELALEVIFDKVFCFIAESEPSSLQFGLDLLHAMKSELGLTPSRKCLDFLLHACVSANDLQSSLFVWQEYRTAGLPYNTLTFLRMFQALLAAGEQKAATILERRIPKDDPHVRSIIEACRLTYSKKDKNKVTKKKKKKKA